MTVSEFTHEKPNRPFFGSIATPQCLLVVGNFLTEIAVRNVFSIKRLRASLYTITPPSNSGNNGKDSHRT